MPNEILDATQSLVALGMVGVVARGSQKMAMRSVGTRKKSLYYYEPKIRRRYKWVC